MVSLIFAALMIEGYYIVSYWITSSSISKMQNLVKEANATSGAEGFYTFCDNVLRQMLYEPSTLVLGKNSSTLTDQHIEQMFQLDGQIHEQHSFNIEIHNLIYRDAFSVIQMLNPCPILFERKVIIFTPPLSIYFLKKSEQQKLQNQAVNNAECESFAQSAVFQGMAVALARYFEGFRFLNTVFKQFMSNSAAVFEDYAPQDSYLKQISATNTTYNKIVSLIPTQPGLEMIEMDRIYIRYSYRYLIDKMLESIKKSIQNSLTTSLAIFVSFIALLFIMYFFFWLPHTSSLNRSIQRTRSLLTMVPLSIIKETRSIRVFVRKYLSQHSVSNYKEK